MSNTIDADRLINVSREIEKDIPFFHLINPFLSIACVRDKLSVFG